MINRELFYGLPHIRCHYAGKSVNSNRLDPEAMCVCCGRPAHGSHHFPPKGTCPIRHREGMVLRPALFAVCGSGTTGCHGGWHGGARYTAYWKWDSPEYENQWRDGTLLRRYGEHSPELYLYGCWVIVDKRMGCEWEERCR